MVDPVEPTEEAVAGSASESAAAATPHNTHTLQYIAWGITILGILLEFMKSRHEAVKNGEKPLPFDLEKILDWAHVQRKQPLSSGATTVHKSSRHRLLTIGLGLAAVVIALLLAINEIIKFIFWIPSAFGRWLIHSHRTVKLAAQDAKAAQAANAARIAAQQPQAAAQSAAPSQAGAAAPIVAPIAATHGSGHAGGHEHHGFSDYFWGPFKFLGLTGFAVICIFALIVGMTSAFKVLVVPPTTTTRATVTSTTTQPTAPDTPTPPAAATPDMTATSPAIQADGCPADTDCHMLARVPAYHNDSQFTDWEDVDLNGKTAHMNMDGIRARCRTNGSEWSDVSDVAECHGELQVISMRDGGTTDIRDLSYYLN